MTIFGYISTLQDFECYGDQKQALRDAGCKMIFRDLCCSESTSRKGWGSAVKAASSGDCIVVCRLDCIGNSIQNTLEILHHLHQKGIYFRSLEEGLDSQQLERVGLFDFITSILNCSKKQMQTRTQLGLQKAKEQGRIGGRPKALSSKTIDNIKTIYENRTQSIQEICKQWGISRPTFYKYLNMART